MADQNKSGSAGGPDDEAIQDLLQKCKDNPDYKVLTRAEYEKLLALSLVVTTTPHTLRTQSIGQDVRPRFTFRNPLDASSPIPRFQQRFINSPGFNTSFIAQPFHPPKLPIFSGSEEPQKGETSYEVWSFEVKCLQNVADLPEHVLLQSIRTSLRGAARSMLIPLGEHASVTDILNKLNGFYGNVKTGETLMQTFTMTFRKILSLLLLMAPV